MIKGLRIAVEREGEGPPVVLLHGGLSDSREWQSQIDDLSDEFTIVAWDAPGCGQSADPPVSFRMSDYADCLAELVGVLELGRPHVVGLSFGGTLALELYRRYPELPRTLTLASAYAGWAGWLPPDRVAERLERALRELDEPPRLVARRWAGELLSQRAPRELVGELVEIVAAFRLEGSRTMAHAMAEADLRAVLPQVDVDTLLVYGSEDERSPREVREHRREHPRLATRGSPRCRPSAQHGGGGPVRRRAPRVPPCVLDQPPPYEGSLTEPSSASVQWGL